MNSYSLTHLADHVLLRELAALLTQERAATAAVLAHMAEVDERRLYAPAGYASMYLYCLGHLRLSEDAAAKRIQAARTAREFPAIFASLADGRLHLSAVVMLAPHLTPKNAADLLAGAEHRTKAEIAVLLAEHFPQPDLPTLVTPIATCAVSAQHAPGHVGMTIPELAPGPVGVSMPEHAPGHVAATTPQPEPRAKLSPLSPQRFALQVTLTQETHEKLRYLQELLSHAVPKGDVAAVLDRAIDALIEKEEQRRFAACVRTRPRRSHGGGRYVPAQVRREVWQRDGGQCTFVGANGHRCQSRERLELDHVDPVAKGGHSTTANLRLCCHAHNQYAADRTFGAGFMRRKREQKQHRSVPDAAAPPKRAPQPPAAVPALDPEVIPYLRSLGFRTDEARAAAARCMAIASAPLEERVRYAISTLAPAHARHVAPGAAS